MRPTALLALLILGVLDCSLAPEPRLAASPETHARAPEDTPAVAPLSVAPLDPTGQGSSIALATVGAQTVAYVADEDDRALVALDADTLRAESRVTLGGTPASVLVLADGRRVVSLRDTSELVVVSGAGVFGEPMRVVARVATPTEPLGLATDSRGATLLVACGWAHKIAGFRAGDLTRDFEVDVGREPRSVVVAADDRRAFVSHAIGSELDVLDLEGKRVTAERSVRTKEFVGGGFESGSFEVDVRGAQGYALARSVAPAGRVLAPHAVVRSDAVDIGEGGGAGGYGQTELGPTEAFDVAVLDEDTGDLLKGSLTSSAGASCVLPRAAVATEGGELLVACLGSGEVRAYAQAALIPADAETRVFKVPAGPTGIALDESHARAFVWSQFAHAVTSIALHGDASLALASATITRESQMSDAMLLGRALFHASDARVSSDGRACASCHPDGRDDGLVWATPDGPRNPPMLAGRLAGAAPYGWLGDGVDVATHMQKTQKRLGGKGFSDDEKAALVSYVQSMKAPAQAKSEPAKDALIEEGRAIFTGASAGCTTCHGDDGQTDGLTHDVRSKTPTDKKREFDTPSLKLVGGTAPYFHDGRYATLGELVEKVDGKMGHTKQLSAHEKQALVAYLGSLR